MKVLDIVNQACEAAQASDPLSGVRDWLRHLGSNPAAVASALAHIPGRGPNAEQAFYRSPDLTLLKVRFPVGRRTPPHDHGTWAAILVLSGREKNTLYKPDEEGRLELVSEVALGAGSVLPMRAETVHVAECAADEDAIGLHVYGGDVVTLPRRMWHPETLAPSDYEAEAYEQLARLASRATNAPRP